MGTLRGSMVETKKNSFRLDGFDCRQQVAVARKESDVADLTLRRKERHIEAEHKVDPLLLKERQAGRRVTPSVCEFAFPHVESRDPVKATKEALCVRKTAPFLVRRRIALERETVIVVRSKHFIRPAIHAANFS